MESEEVDPRVLGKGKGGIPEERRTEDPQTPPTTARLSDVIPASWDGRGLHLSF